MRISSGVAGFDDLIEGGLPSSRLYVLCGPPGSGKTTFSSQFLVEGVRQGDNCLFVSMHESREDIVEDMSGYDFDFDQAIRTDRMAFIDVFSNDGKQLFRMPGNRRGSNDVVNRLTSHIESQNVDRIVVDSTMLLQYFLDDTDNSAIQFFTALKRTDVTAILISEMTDPSAYADEHYLAHGVIFLHNFLEEEGMRRGVQVLKMRGTAVDTDIHELSFSDDGLHVGGQQLQRH